MASLLDFRGSAPYQKDLFTTLYRTFWGRLARNKVELLGAPPLYHFLLGLSLAGLLGTVVATWQQRRQLPWESLLLLFLVTAGAWITTFFRGLGTGGAIIPWARYAVPAILPTALALCSGWYIWLRRLLPKFGLSPTQGYYGLLSLFLTLSVIAWLSLTDYFYPDRRPWVFIPLYLSLFLMILRTAQYFSDFLRAHAANQESSK